MEYDDIIEVLTTLLENRDEVSQSNAVHMDGGLYDDSCEAIEKHLAFLLKLRASSSEEEGK